jgi:hypothetical protein
LHNGSRRFVQQIVGMGQGEAGGVGRLRQSPRESVPTVQIVGAAPGLVDVGPVMMGMLPGDGAVEIEPENGIPLRNVPTEGMNEVETGPSGFVSTLVTVEVESDGHLLWVMKMTRECWMVSPCSQKK